MGTKYEIVLSFKVGLFNQFTHENKESLFVSMKLFLLWL